jgi:hypothetical protein
MTNTSLRREEIGSRKRCQIAARAARTLAEACARIRVCQRKVVPERPVIVRTWSTAGEYLAHGTTALSRGSRFERGREKGSTRRGTAEFHRPEIVDEHAASRLRAILNAVTGDSEQTGAGKKQSEQVARLGASRHERLPQTARHFGSERADQGIGLFCLVRSNVYHREIRHRPHPMLVARRSLFRRAPDALTCLTFA